MFCFLSNITCICWQVTNTSVVLLYIVYDFIKKRRECIGSLCFRLCSSHIHIHTVPSDNPVSGAPCRSVKGKTAFS